ncbi:hypothetical protein N9Y17_01370 [Gammaproteobacteria bacterium]|nr:hypothetical protein [Gammaproteobacteria bacterium]
MQVTLNQKLSVQEKLKDALKKITEKSGIVDRLGNIQYLFGSWNDIETNWVKPYFQALKTYGEKHANQLLELTFVYGLCEANKGKLTISSEGLFTNKQEKHFDSNSSLNRSEIYLKDTWQLGLNHFPTEYLAYLGLLTNPEDIQLSSGKALLPAELISAARFQLDIQRSWKGIASNKPPIGVYTRANLNQFKDLLSDQKYNALMQDFNFLLVDEGQKGYQLYQNKLENKNPCNPKPSIWKRYSLPERETKLSCQPNGLICRDPSSQDHQWSTVSDKQGGKGSQDFTAYKDHHLLNTLVGTSCNAKWTINQITPKAAEALQQTPHLFQMGLCLDQLPVGFQLLPAEISQLGGVKSHEQYFKDTYLLDYDEDLAELKAPSSLAADEKQANKKYKDSNNIGEVYTALEGAQAAVYKKFQKELAEGDKDLLFNALVKLHQSITVTYKLEFPTQALKTYLESFSQNQDQIEQKDKLFEAHTFLKRLTACLKELKKKHQIDQDFKATAQPILNSINQINWQEDGLLYALKNQGFYGWSADLKLNGFKAEVNYHNDKERSYATYLATWPTSNGVPELYLGELKLKALRYLAVRLHLTSDQIEKYKKALDEIFPNDLKIPNNGQQQKEDKTYHHRVMRILVSSLVYGQPQLELISDQGKIAKAVKDLYIKHYQLKGIDSKYPIDQPSQHDVSDKKNVGEYVSVQVPFDQLPEFLEAEVKHPTRLKPSSISPLHLLNLAYRDFQHIKKYDDFEKQGNEEVYDHNKPDPDSDKWDGCFERWIGCQSSETPAKFTISQITKSAFDALVELEETQYLACGLSYDHLPPGFFLKNAIAEGHEGCYVLTYQQPGQAADDVFAEAANNYKNNLDYLKTIRGGSSEEGDGAVHPFFYDGVEKDKWWDDCCTKIQETQKKKVDKDWAEGGAKNLLLHHVVDLLKHFNEIYEGKLCTVPTILAKYLQPALVELHTQAYKGFDDDTAPNPGKINFQGFFDRVKGCLDALHDKHGNTEQFKQEADHLLDNLDEIVKAESNSHRSITGPKHTGKYYALKYEGFASAMSEEGGDLYLKVRGTPAPFGFDPGNQPKSPKKNHFLSWYAHRYQLKSQDFEKLEALFKNINRNNEWVYKIFLSTLINGGGIDAVDEAEVTTFNKSTVKVGGGGLSIRKVCL